uniref:Cingulin-like n=1 Tax=Rhizophora mucronata TaxID=61149 RepID=A0A2P2JQP3_RHIMU
MSRSWRSYSGDSFDVEELFRIESRCRELRKEKETLRESQSQSFELIRALELHVKSLSEARSEDRKHIQELEKELLNCSQEIDYLQDQLNVRNAEVFNLGEHVHHLELKLAGMDGLQAKVGLLEEELRNSNSECSLLVQQLKSKEAELHKSALCIKKLEESISCLTLDSQCEIESMKLDVLSLEQAWFEAKKIQEETALANENMNGLIKKFQSQINDAEDMIKYLEKETKILREKLVVSEVNSRIFLQVMEEWLENGDRSELTIQSYFSELENKSDMSTEMRDVLCSLFSKVATILAPDLNLKEQMERMSHQISSYEILVEQLKEELREEKLKAKEEAEDLAQEMAELRYKMTSLLEEECKRRACIEQASMQRIAELEAQIQKEQKKPFPFVGCRRQA